MVREHDKKLSYLEQSISSRIIEVIKSLKNNRFDAVATRNEESARQSILNNIPYGATVGLSDSATLKQLGIADVLITRGLRVIDPYSIQALREFEQGLVSREKRISSLKSTISCEVFIAGSNAITEDGKIVNMDAIGNRVAGMIFGPRKVFIVVGSNKIVHDVDQTLYRIKNLIAPFHAKHKGCHTPCVDAGMCLDCNSSDRICRIYVILERRPICSDISVIIINDDLGLGWNPDWPTERIKAIQSAYLEAGVAKMAFKEK